MVRIWAYTASLQRTMNLYKSGKTKERSFRLSRVENWRGKYTTEKNGRVFFFDFYFLSCSKSGQGNASLFNSMYLKQKPKLHWQSDPLSNLSIPHSVQLSKKNLVASSIYSWRPLPLFQIPVGAYYYIIC